ncbi:polyprenyl synthetase family protein [Candidatus Tisiphia endosymbiont of Nemotelus uliginosus]|uniref:polyprenyl synthetase family protein n=1 Tax=Candidatus Tisiphia endosymbiont of Nemotelus uliginosus TaxID=3077926 RepID=UPI0035C90166
MRHLTTSEYTLDIITTIHQNLTIELAQLNEVIINRLSVKEELVTLVGKHLLESGGKRIRPLLTILTSKMFGYNGDNNIKLAAAVEFIHAATLLHDDVVDESNMRRSKPTAHVIWGSKASILVGDFLFSQAFQLMVDTSSIKAMSSLAKASAIISQGEVAQLVKLNERRVIDEIEYQEIILAKTAELFGASCEAGARIANQPDNICNILHDFGKILGNIFQVIDDLFDYLGNSEILGKNIGDDFLEGKVTLPLIFLYKQLDSDWQAKISQMLKANTRTKMEFRVVKDLMLQYDIRSQIMEYLEHMHYAVNKLLNQISLQNIYKDHLKLLIDFLLNRSY